MRGPRVSDTVERAPDRIPADVWVLVASAFIIALGYGIIAPVLPQFAASFGVGVTASAVVVSAFAFCRLLFAPAGGGLVDRFGEPPVYVAGLLVVAVSTGATAFAQNYWQLLIFRGLGGLGSVMFTVSAMVLIMRIAPPGKRGRVSSLYATAFLTGSVAGPVIGGLMAGLGMRVPFIVYAIALVIAAIVVGFRLDPNLRRSHAEAGAALPTMTFAQAWGDSAYRAAVVSAFANGWSSMGIRVALYPLFAVQVLGEGPAFAGIALTVFALGNASAQSFTGRLSDARGRKPLIVSGLVVTGLATGAIGFTENLWVFLALSIVAGVGAGMLGPVQQAAVGDIVGDERSGGTVFARFQMFMDAGAIAGPILVGLLADTVGFRWSFVATGALVLIAALVWTRGRETLERGQAQPQGGGPGG